MGRQAACPSHVLKSGTKAFFSTAACHILPWAVAGLLGSLMQCGCLVATKRGCYGSRNRTFQGAYQSLSLTLLLSLGCRGSQSSLEFVEIVSQSSS